MTSEPAPAGRRQLYVWVWLSGAQEPVVAGVLTGSGGRFQGQEVLTYTCARSYRERADAISLFTPELPLRAGTFDPAAPSQIPGTIAPTAQASNPFARNRRRSPLPMHGCLRDAAPDAWGRRIINLRLAGNPKAELDELTYLEASGSNRIGALEFQDSATEYVARGTPASLEQLLHAAELVEAGAALPVELAAAAIHGTSIGGARPKALLEDGGRHLIAKFSSSTDTGPWSRPRPQPCCWRPGQASTWHRSRSGTSTGKTSCWSSGSTGPPRTPGGPWSPR